MGINTSDSVNEVIWRGDVTFDSFKTIVHRWIDKYFRHPSHYKIDGKPVLMIYSITNFLKSFGGTDGTRKAISNFRDEVEKAGFPGQHLQLVYNAFEGFDYDRYFGGEAGDVYELLDFDSVSHYNIGTRAERNYDYTEIIKNHKRSYDRMDEEGRLYFPQVSLGWDNNPRFRTFQPEITRNNTQQKSTTTLQITIYHINCK